MMNTMNAEMKMAILNEYCDQMNELANREQYATTNGFRIISNDYGIKWASQPISDELAEQIDFCLYSEDINNIEFDWQLF